MIKIAYITNAGPNSGVGHRAEEIAKRLSSQVELDRWHINGEQGQLLHNGQVERQIKPWPGILGSKSVNWVRLGKKLNNLTRPSADLSLVRRGDRGIYHLTNQTLSFLVKKLHPSVVTIHDIIELLEPQNKTAYLLNRYLYSGIAKADHLITVSQYTAQTIREYYGIAAEKISVILNGVGPEFHPIANFKQTIAFQTLRQELKLPPEAKIILYVGSDHPRKNVVGAVQAFAKFQTKFPDAIFLKVGEPGIAAGRAILLQEIDALGIRGSVRFIGNVSLERLNELYNLADVFIYPSRFEGFGLPPLQAIAAGTLVLTSNTTSLPEVVGDAAIMHDPDDITAFATDLERVTNDHVLRQKFIAAGLDHSKQFSWEKAAEQELDVYRTLHS